MTDKMSTIKITVFGTTSSGKSTFLNLLVGAELLPSGVQETTLGQVVIRHDRMRRLSLDNAEFSAELPKNPRAHHIHETLQKQFEAQRSQGVLNAKSPLINWPTRIGTRLRRAGRLNTVVELIDSPGLRFIGDERY